MAAPMSPVRRRRLEQAHVEILRRPTPHVYPNLNLSNYVERGSVGWRTWRRFNWQQPLWRAAWPFLLQLVGGYGLTNDQQILLDHERMLDARRCHSWNDMGWCFCEEAPR